MTLKTIEWKDNSVIMIDQTKLPNILEYVTYTDYNQVADAIRTLVVRGAPAIGVSGAFGLALAALQSDATEKEGLINYLENAKKILFETRPTAVNLAWGLDKIMEVANQAIIDFWRSCNGKRKVTELVDLFAQQTGLQRSQVEKEVMQLLKQLHEGGLLVIPTQNDEPNVEFKSRN